jgi:hypothetical protein
LQSLTLQQSSDFLQRVLTTLVSEGLSATRVHLGTLRSALLQHDIPEELTDQAIGWFGLIDGDYWEPDLDDISKMIGLALLSEHKVRSSESCFHSTNLDQHEQDPTDTRG